MDNARKFYIDGAWVAPITPGLPGCDQSRERGSVIEQIAVGSAADVDRAVAAAKAAFPSLFTNQPGRSASRCWSALLEAYKDALRGRPPRRLSREMGAPISLARNAQAAIGVGHLTQMIATLREL